MLRSAGFRTPRQASCVSSLAFYTCYLLMGSSLLPGSPPCPPGLGQLQISLQAPEVSPQKFHIELRSDRRDDGIPLPPQPELPWPSSHSHERSSAPARLRRLGDPRHFSLQTCYASPHRLHDPMTPLSWMVAHGGLPWELAFYFLLQAQGMRKSSNEEGFGIPEFSFQIPAARLTGRGTLGE